jgi:peptide/nickel transport system substrate-binding protein
MKIAVKTIEGENAGELELADAVFAAPVRQDILQRCVVWQLARRQQGTHKSKGRAEVTATAKKMYAQKGTGRARHGNEAAPQFRGGGKAFGPIVRSHAQDLPKKVRKLALRTALSAKAAEGKLIILEQAALAEPKTAKLKGHFGKLGVSSVLVIGGAELDQNFARAAANIAHVDVLPQQGANVYDILRRDTLVLGMTLEPTGLDPTAGAASSIAEVVHYNIFETLTKINADGSVSPLLAESWEVSPDLRTYTFALRKGVKFSNGEPFNAATVKYAFERAASDKSSNKDKRTFTAMQSVRPAGEHTVVITNQEPDPDFLFYLGQATAVMVEPKSADGNAATPVGTGPYVLDNWAKGASLSLKAWPGFRNPGAIKIKRATFRFIGDPAAQVAAVLAGDVDAFTRVTERGLAQFKSNARLQVIINGSRAKTVLAINNARKPLNDVRVRRAISMAIDRKAVIAGAASGLGVPIGSHYVPGAAGYVDTTGINAYDPRQAKALLQQAGVATPLELSLVLPPPAYARQGGEVIVAELAKIGITAKVQNVEWAQWMADVYGGAHNYDLTIISHVEPFDLVNFTKPDYYWGYNNPKFAELFTQIKTAPSAAERNKLLGEAQKMLAEDAALAWLYQPQWVTVADKRLGGLWKDLPIFVNDLSALSWG